MRIPINQIGSTIQSEQSESNGVLSSDRNLGGRVDSLTSVRSNVS